VRVLLDTCVLSELRHPKGDAGVRRAVDGFDSESLFVSVLSIGKIAKGIVLLRESQNKRALQIWLQTLERHYGDRRFLSILKQAASGENSQPPPRRPGAVGTGH
jgi:hypothetical protein